MKNTKTKLNKKLLVIVLIVLLLALAIGYAAFSDVLRVSGTANAKGSFDLEFRNAKLVNSAGVDVTNSKLTISENKNELTVNTANLAYPGAGAEYSVDIYNNGSISADVTDVVYNRTKGNDFIKIEGLEQINESHKTLAPGETCNIHFTVRWDENATNALESESESVTYTLTLNYEQSNNNKTFTGNTSHTDTTK